MTSSSPPNSSNTPPVDTGRPTRITRKKRKQATIGLTTVFVIMGAIWLLYYLIWGQFQVYTDDAYVNGNLVAVMSQVPGTIVRIDTDDTYLVKQGQTLIQLDPSDTAIALQRARATLAQTVRQVRQAYELAAEARAALVARQADLIKAQLDLKRRHGLLGERAISKEELQHYQTAATAALAQYQYALHKLGSATAMVENAHLYSHPQVEAAKAAFKTAYLNYVRTTIVAPVTGYVAKRSVQLGQQVGINTPLLAIVPLNEVWVDANYKESQLSDLRIDQPVTLYADAYPNATFHGKVVGLNAGTGAAFSLLPPQNATGNWIKIVQRLPVRISLDPNEIRNNPLQIGLSMRVTTSIRHTNGPRLATLASQKPLYSTDVYATQLQAADSLILQIMKANAPDVFLPAVTMPFPLEKNEPTIMNKPVKKHHRYHPASSLKNKKHPLT